MQPVSSFIGKIAEQISIPEVYLQIRRLIEKPDAEIQDFVDTIQQDSMLAVRTIRIANSPFFGFPRRAKDLHQAISLIGVMQLHDLALSCLAMRTFAYIPQQVFNLEAFWKYSVQCGIAAKLIAQCSLSLPVNLYFSLGLLHEIGHAALFARQPELSLQALEQSQLQNTCITRLEHDYFGFDYTQIGTTIMQMWQLPELYQQSAACHLQPQLASEKNQHAINIVHLAHNICQNPQPGKHRMLIENSRANDPRLQQLPANIEELILNEITTHADSLLRALWPYSMKDSAV
ncbi:MAG: HDOD domain-containing protein [Gammaproteobacteria bacterium]|nr:HDOD domain-containing protein [Gammaproteobacteria bacterium]